MTTGGQTTYHDGRDRVWAFEADLLRVVQCLVQRQQEHVLDDHCDGCDRRERGEDHVDHQHREFLENSFWETGRLFSRWEQSPWTC